MKDYPSLIFVEKEGVFCDYDFEKNNYKRWTLIKFVLNHARRNKFLKEGVYSWKDIWSVYIRSMEDLIMTLSEGVYEQKELKEVKK